MQFVAFLLASSFLSACAIHVHVHETPQPVATAASQPSGAGHGALPAGHPATGVVSGIVRDAEGSGVKARIAAVGIQGGSYATSTSGDGRFDLDGVPFADLVLHASTEEGQIAVARSHSGAQGVELVLRAGATLVVELGGPEKARLAVFADDLRIEDFTLKPGEPSTVVVPAGEVRLRVYQGDQVLEEREVSASAGSTVKIRMQPHS